MALLPKTVTRETLATVFDQGRHRRVVVDVDPPAGVVVFRLKGTRRRYSLPVQYLYLHALKKAVALEKANKAKERKARRGKGRNQ